jgi:CRISPR/Cas system-associated exonuclease Cas4 (RecB family)
MWRPRSSKVGYYMQCTERAWLDRRIGEKSLTLADLGLPADADSSSVPADFGTIAHWTIQCALRAGFPAEGVFAPTPWNEDAARAKKPDPEVWLSGSKLFRQNDMAGVLSKITTAAITRLPRKGSKWLAESRFDVGVLTGSIDLLTDDFEDIVDIKTTGTQPAGGRIKPAHLWQLVAYALGVSGTTGVLPKRGYILYLHNRGEWVCRSNPVEFTPELVGILLNRIRAVSGPAAESFAAPAFGQACDDFCPYVPHCHRHLPRGAHIVDLDAAAGPPGSTDPFAP